MYMTTIVHCYLADGQKIAKKLSLQISKETKKIKELLPEFNACHVVVSKHEPLQLQEVLDSSKLTTIVHPHSSSSKRELIDAYFTIKRADEEISMVAMEMTYTRQHYVHEISAVQNCIQQYSKKTDAFSRGSVALLHGLLTKLNIRVIEIHDLFSVISNSSTSVPVIPGGTSIGSDSDEEMLVKD